MTCLPRFFSSLCTPYPGSCACPCANVRIACQAANFRALACTIQCFHSCWRGRGSMQSGKCRPPPACASGGHKLTEVMLQDLAPCPAGDEKPAGRKGKAAGSSTEPPAAPSAVAAEPVGATEGSAQDAAKEVVYEVLP